MTEFLLQIQSKFFHTDKLKNNFSSCVNQNYKNKSWCNWAYLATALFSFSAVWAITVAIKQSHAACTAFCVFCKVIIHDNL